MFVRFISLFFTAALLALLTVPVAADPPFPPKQNRQNHTWASGFENSNITSGFRQVGIMVNEFYDVKGIYKSSTIGIHEYKFEYLTTGYRETHRLLECQVPREAIRVRIVWMEAEAVLDPASSDCVGSRTICTTVSYSSNCTSDADHGFPKQWVLGYWDYATFSDDSVENHRLWDRRTTDNTVRHCRRVFADGMTVGGFHIGTWHKFTGFDGNTLGTYEIYSCNEKM